MKISKLLIAVVTGCTLAFSVTAMAATKTPTTKAAAIQSSITAKQAAIDLAKAEVPAGSNFFGAKSKGMGEYKVLFQDPATLDYYEVDIENGRIDEIEIKGSDFPGSVTINKTPEDVKAKILETYPDATNIVVTKEDDPKAKNLMIYKAKFTTPKFTGEAQLNPATCLYGHRELKYKK